MMKPTKLHEIIAVLKTKKAQAERMLTDAHQSWHPAALSGLVRTYEPINEEGEQLSSEAQLVQTRVRETIAALLDDLANYYDCVAMQETGNTHARAAIRINGREILPPQPVGILLFLEKRTEDLHTFFSKLPTLPADKKWKWDANRACFTTAPVEKVRTQKMPQVLVKYEATKEHPAQTDVFTIDKAIGTYQTVHLSGAVPITWKEHLLKRIHALRLAIKTAREQANATEVEQVKCGHILLNYLLMDFLAQSEA